MLAERLADGRCRGAAGIRSLAARAASVFDGLCPPRLASLPTPSGRACGTVSRATPGSLAGPLRGTLPGSLSGTLTRSLAARTASAALAAPAARPLPAPITARLPRGLFGEVHAGWQGGGRVALGNGLAEQSLDGGQPRSLLVVAE